MIDRIRRMLSPQERRIIGAEAKQALENKHWNEAIEAVEGYLIEKTKGCDLDSKHGPEKAARIAQSMQLLEAIKRELVRKIEDGEFAAIEMQELERKSRPLRFVR